MTARFDRPIATLEQYARLHPTGYQWRVAWLTILGYAYPIALFGTLAVLLWPFSQYYTIAILGGLAKLFWLKSTPPEGIAIDRTQYPELFKELDDLQTQLRTPPIHNVLLTDDLNAAVLQQPRLGLLGWYRNHLILGVPLMQVSSPEQFRSTLAHELGHLSGQHSRITNWVYRVRYAWETLSRQNEHQPSLLLLPFFRWYEPFFRTYTFVLSRSHEYQADRCAADCAGVENAADDLMQLSVRGRHWYKEYWSNLLRPHSLAETPPDKAISGLLQALSQPLPANLAEACRAVALARPMDDDDTHPSLRERLTHYNLADRPVPQPPSTTAAQHLLANHFDSVVTELDRRWQSQQIPSWQQRRHFAREDARLLQQLNSAAILTPEQQWKRAMLTAPQAPKNAVALLKSALTKTPDHPNLNYDLGCLLLEQNQIEAFRYLEVAFSANPVALAWSFEAICGYLYANGREPDAANYLAQFEQVQDLRRLAQRECEQLNPRDSWQTHGLDPDEVAQITATLEQYPELREAHLVRKQLTRLPDFPLYVLALRSGINRQNPLQTLQGEGLVAAIRSRLCLSGSVRILPIAEGSSPLYRAIRRISGAKLNLK
jgi:Zn-dependent protease with chaperone function